MFFRKKSQPLTTQQEIQRLQLKIYRMYTFQERVIDLVFGTLIVIVVFGIGFTLGYHFR